MGKLDSSRTRVEPIFDSLFAADPSGASWLNRTMALASRSAVAASPPPNQRLVEDHGKRWGKAEERLAAPQLLLENLVNNLDLERVDSAGDSGETLRRRRLLAKKDKPTISEALRRIRAGERGRHWFILEGPSRPDALLETADMVLCIEGKRTEHGCTTKTKWMRRRSQLVRHMDAAFDAFPGRRILGLLIVEGERQDPLVASVHWQEESAAQYELAMLKDTLPHRTPSQRETLASGVLGVTTWQAVCAANDLRWPPRA
jgi:hypothetical protein